MYTNVIAVFVARRKRVQKPRGRRRSRLVLRYPTADACVNLGVDVQVWSYLRQLYRHVRVCVTGRVVAVVVQ